MSALVLLLVVLALVLWVLVAFRPVAPPESRREHRCRWDERDDPCPIPTEGGRDLCRRHRERLRAGRG